MVMMRVSANQNPLGGRGARRPALCPAINLQCDLGHSVTPQPTPGLSFLSSQRGRVRNAGFWPAVPFGGLREPHFLDPFGGTAHPPGLGQAWGNETEGRGWRRTTHAAAAARVHSKPVFGYTLNHLDCFFLSNCLAITQAWPFVDQEPRAGKWHLFNWWRGWSWFFHSKYTGFVFILESPSFPYTPSMGSLHLRDGGSGHLQPELGLIGASENKGLLRPRE